MKRLFSAFVAMLLATASVGALACPGDKAPDGKGATSVPEKPKT